MKYVIAIVTLLLITQTGYGQCATLGNYHHSSMKSIFAQYGYGVRTYYTYGDMGKGEYTTFSRKFYYGNDYALGVVGDENARDIDIYIFDSQGNLIEQDKNTDKTAIATFRARYTGTYYIRVKMYDTMSYRDACWTLVYAYK